ncbi:hypothetical protein ES703_56998 [subsurface metagenome]
MPVEYLNIREAAEHADVTRQTIYRWVLKGVPVRGELMYLTAVLIAGQYRICAIDLDRFLDALGYEFEDDDSGQDASGNS